MKATQGKGCPRLLALRPLDLPRVAKLSDLKPLKILTPKQMLQRSPIALAKLKQVINLKTYQMKSDKLYNLCIEQKFTFQL